MSTSKYTCKMVYIPTASQKTCDKTGSTW